MNWINGIFEVSNKTQTSVFYQSLTNLGDPYRRKVSYLTWTLMGINSTIKPVASRAGGDRGFTKCDSLCSLGPVLPVQWSHVYCRLDFSAYYSVCKPGFELLFNFLTSSHCRPKWVYLSTQPFLPQRQPSCSRLANRRGHCGNILIIETPLVSLLISHPGFTFALPSFLEKHLLNVRSQDVSDRTQNRVASFAGRQPERRRGREIFLPNSFFSRRSWLFYTERGECNRNLRGYVCACVSVCEQTVSVCVQKKGRGVCWSAKGKGIHGCWKKHDVIGVIHGSVHEFTI